MNGMIISIITVVYNSVKSIEDTILSILSCDEYEIEYIVIDGGSTDGTFEIINKYLNELAVFLSEPDKGIYDAMNKGISLSTGEFIGFINSGDKLLYLPYKDIKLNRESHINCFPVKLSNGSIFMPAVNGMLRLNNTLHHQGCFYKRTDDLMYDTRFKVFSDFNLNQILYKSNKEIKVFKNPVVAFHDMGGISNDKNNSGEIFEVVLFNFGHYYKLLSWLFFKKQGFLKRLKNLYH